MFIDHIAGFECMKWLVSGRAFFFFGSRYLYEDTDDSPIGCEYLSFSL